jgi:hypothetical protein
VRWVNTGTSDGEKPISWLEVGVRQALTQAIADLSTTTPRNRRARPLIGMPAFGTGAGGYNGQRGQVLDMLLRLTRELIHDSNTDLVFASNSRADYAALQSRPERLHPSTTLTHQQTALADDLGTLARDNQLVLFLGAGISVPAGLPSWRELLRPLADKAPDIDPDELLPAHPDYPRAASILRDALGETFDTDIDTALSRTEHALGHSILASLRCDEVITTNFDDLYEQAARTTFQPRQLSVLPWARATPGQPWLLKMHGGIKRHTILTREDFDTYNTHWRPLASVVQTLLLTRHVLFVGYSLTDENFVRLGREVTTLLTRTVPENQRLLGTVLTLKPDPELTEQWTGSLRAVAALDDPDDTATPSDRPDVESGRRLEIFLDRIAATAAATEKSYALDRRYKELLTDPENAKIADTLRTLAADPALTHPVWAEILKTLRSHGAT